MLKVLGVSRSGYRAFSRRKLSATAKRKYSIKKEILKIYNDSKQNYGAPKIAKLLQKSEETISQRTVGKYMREMGIRAQWAKPWIATTKDSDFSSELHNILNEQFNSERPNAIWCTDITYIWTQNGFVYLNCVMDLFARKIIAWTLSETMEVSNVIDTIEKAKAIRNTDLPLKYTPTVEASMCHRHGVKPPKICNAITRIRVILTIMHALNPSIHLLKENGLTVLTLRITDTHIT